MNRWYVQDAAKFLAKKMADELTGMPIEEAMPICRACGHYLNLTSIAETHHRFFLQLKCLETSNTVLQLIGLAKRAAISVVQCADN